MEKNNEHNDQNAVSKAVAHEMETTETLYATEYMAPPPLFLASDPKHLKEEVEGEEKGQKSSTGEVTDQEDQKNSPNPLGADMKSDASVLTAGAKVKEEETEEEIIDGPAADLIFADDTPEAPNDDGSEENGAAEGDNPDNGDDGNNDPIQKKEGNASSTSGSDSSRGVPAEVMSKMEASMGTDFSNVNVHTNSSQARDTNALAFAKGNDIHFAPGRFDPKSNSGQKLLGHELAHVKQQRQGKVKPTTSINGLSINDDPALERAADFEGDRAANYSGAIQRKKASSTDLNPIVQKKVIVPASSENIQQSTDSQNDTSETSQLQTSNDGNSIEANSNEKVTQQKEEGTVTNDVAQLQEDKSLFEELSAESGNLIRSIAEIARLVPGLGIVTGGLAQAINFEQDHAAAEEHAPNDDFLLFLVDYRNGINFINGFVDDLLYLNQVVGDCGGHATGITEAIGVIGGLVNNGLDGAQVSIDIITTAYTATVAAFPEAFEVENTGVYEDFALGYAANTVADSVGLVLGVIDTATAATGQGAVADRLGDGFFALTKLQQVVRIICRKLADPKDLFGILTGVVVGVNGGSLAGGAIDIGREILATKLDGYIDNVETVWDFGSGGIDYMAEAVPAAFEMARAGIMEMCDGEDPIIWIRDKMVQGINDATEQAEQMNTSARNLVEADQTLDTVIQNLDEVGSEISALQLPSDIFPEHTEVGDNPLANAVEGVIDAGAGVANQAANELLAELQTRLDEFKKDALEKLKEAKEFSIKVQLVVKHAANLFLNAHSQCIEIIQRFSARLAQAETLEDFLNVALGTVGDVIGLEGGLSVDDMRKNWDALKDTMDTSFARARELVNEYVRGQEVQQNSLEDPVQQKAVEPQGGGGKSDATSSFENLFNAELHGFDVENIAQEYLPEAHSLAGIKSVDGMMEKVSGLMQIPDEITGIISDPAGVLKEKASSFLESSGLGSVIEGSGLNKITDFATSLQFKKDDTESVEPETSALSAEPIQKFDWDFGIGEAIGKYRDNHYDRNQHNQAPQQEPVDDPNWRLLPDSQSIYHQNGEQGQGNRKYVSTNGGNFEAVYDSNGQLVTDDANMGTYNFSGPDDTSGHLVDDVIPYWLFGNNQNDDTPLANRIAGPRIMERTGTAIGNGAKAAGNFLGDVWNNTGGQLFGGDENPAQQKLESDQATVTTEISSFEPQAIQNKEKIDNEENNKQEDVGQFQISDVIPSGVNVHQESSKATEMGALAFAQGSDIHFAPGKFDTNSRQGQELIGHELGHVKQQKEGRVQPTTQLKGANVNDDKGLEKEADDFGVKFADSLQNKTSKNPSTGLGQGFSLNSDVTQKKSESESPMQFEGEPTQDQPAPQAPPSPQSSGVPPASNGGTGGGSGNAPQPSSTGGGGGKSNGGSGQGGGGFSLGNGGGYKSAGKPNGSRSVTLEKGELLTSENDPAYLAEVDKLTEKGEEQKEHDPTTKKVGDAVDSADSPSNEVDSKAKDQQVDKMDQQEAGEFNAGEFKTKLMERVDALAPKNMEEVLDFKGSGKTATLKNEVSTNVTDAKDDSKEDIEETTKEAPDTSGLTKRESTPLPPELPEPEKGDVIKEDAAPKVQDTSLVEDPLNKEGENLDKQMADADITDDQLASSNEPTFITALGSKNTAKDSIATSPSEFRTGETSIIEKGQGEADTEGDLQLTGFLDTHNKEFADVLKGQEDNKTKDEKERLKVADKIESIYESTKSKVETKLSNLDTKVNNLFDTGANTARENFETYVDTRMREYKDKRYGGFFGPGKWVKDKLMGLPSEVNQFYVDGRNKYIEAMGLVIDGIATLVATELNAAKKLIADGRTDIKVYVDGLDPSLKEFAQETADKIDERFDELEQTVTDKQDDLVDNLAQKYSDNLGEIDTRIEELQAANSGLIQKAVDQVKGVIDAINNLKNMLMGVLSGAMGVISAIIKNPIGFLSNLVSGIKAGFQQFAGNIVGHLQTGLMGWLFGQMGEAGLQMPGSFDLKGIFSIITQVVGLTWSYIRSRIVKTLGEDTVTKLEESVDIFTTLKDEGLGGLVAVAGEKIGEIKETVIEGIKSFIIEKVIKAGIMWILSLLNPASAFVKACMAIYDIVMFFINRGSQIMSLVQSIIGSLNAIVGGNIAAMAGAIEGSLAKALPVAISFMASLLGLGGIANRVKKVINKAKAPVNKVVDTVIDKAKNWAAKLNPFGKDKDGDKDENEEETDEGYSKGMASLQRLAASSSNTGKTRKNMADATSGIKNTHGFDTISFTLDGEEWEVKAKKGKDDNFKTPLKVKADLENEDPDKEGDQAADPEVEEKAQKGFAELDAAKRRHKEEGLDRGEAQTIVSQIKARHPVFKKFELVDDGDEWDVSFEYNPTGVRPFVDKDKKVDFVAIDKSIEYTPDNNGNESQLSEEIGKRQSDGTVIVSSGYPGYYESLGNNFKTANDNLSSDSYNVRRTEGLKGAGARPHENYEPKNLVITTEVNENGTVEFILFYDYGTYSEDYGGPKSFEVRVSPEDNDTISHQINGSNLIIESGRGKLAEISGVDQNQGPNANPATPAYDKSHLLADWFMGTGYKSGLNLILTSDNYNRGSGDGTMASAERAVAQYISNIQGQNQGKVVSFDISVTANYSIVEDNEVLSALRSLQHPDIEGVALMKTSAALQSKQNPRISHGVNYYIPTVYVDGDVVGGGFETDIGGDKKLN